MGHPLDIDLLALVEGTMEPEWVERTEAHVAACSLCRRKWGRLLAAQEPDPDSL